MTLAIGAYNQIDNVTLSGGSWNASYPLANIKSKYLFEKSRSTTTTATIQIDLGSPMSIGCVAVIATNVSTSATMLIEGSAVSNYTSIGYSSGSIASYGSADIAKSFSDQTYRYWRITVTDATLSYVEIGRVFIGRRIQFTTHADWGTQYQIESSSTIARALGGPEYVEELPNRRVTTLKFSWLSDNESLLTLLPMLRSHDISQEVYLIYDDADTNYRAFRQYLARFKQLDQLSNPYLNVNGVSLVFTELL
jgi:hypothetical protein